VAGGLVLLWLGVGLWVRALERRVWREAVATLTARAITQERLAKELADMRLEPPTWRGRYLLACRNGDWLQYYTRPTDLNFWAGDWLLARDRDGRWYASRTHFCDMVECLPETQPGSLPELLHAMYFVPVPDPQQVPRELKAFRPPGGGHFATPDDAWEARVGLPPYVPAK
jgi:hypothetical protein